jgi:hypothetical protein
MNDSGRIRWERVYNAFDAIVPAQRDIQAPNHDLAAKLETLLNLLPALTGGVPSSAQPPVFPMGMYPQPLNQGGMYPQPPAQMGWMPRQVQTPQSSAPQPWSADPRGQQAQGNQNTQAGRQQFSGHGNNQAGGPSANGQRSGEGSWAAKVTCFRCGERGHYSNSCPTNGNGNSGQGFQSGPQHHGMKQQFAQQSGPQALPRAQAAVVNRQQDNQDEDYPEFIPRVDGVVMVGEGREQTNMVSGDRFDFAEEVAHCLPDGSPMGSTSCAVYATSNDEMRATWTPRSRNV